MGTRIGLGLLLACGFASLAMAREGYLGTPEEARAMLDRVVAAVKANKSAALDAIQVGAAQFRDRDLYAFCANASDSVMTAHPTLKGRILRDIHDIYGKALGVEIMNGAAEGKISETAYVWPRPDTGVPADKVTLSTRVGDQVCSVGYYK